MALVSGDADPWHLDVGAREGQGPTTAQAVGAEALVSTVLNRRLPGPVRSAAIAPDNTDSRGRVVFERLIADIRKFTAGHRSHHAFAASVAHLADNVDTLARFRDTMTRARPSDRRAYRSRVHGSILARPDAAAQAAAEGRWAAMVQASARNFSTISRRRCRPGS